MAVSCNGGAATAPEGAGPLGKFDKVWQDYDERYAFFDIGGIDWTALRDKYRPRLTETSSDRDLALAIGGMIGELRDYHADLRTSFGTFGPPPIPYPHHFDLAILRTSYLAEPERTTSSGRIVFARLKDGTGYVRIPSFEGAGWGGEISAAISTMGTPPRLVLDIRDNTGGDEAIAIDVASHFYDVTRTYRVSQFRSGPAHDNFARPTTMAVSPSAPHYSGPVAFITNRFDGSSAEDFTLMMRIVPSVVTVGDTTLGVGSNPLGVSLSNGWTYRIPQSKQSTPDGFVYQWRGLPPAIAVPWTDADVAAGKDPYLEAALQELRRRLP
jgi:C-terminal processing protease CtpA/Prc